MSDTLRIRVNVYCWFVIELWKNLAIDGTAKQSSTYENSTAHRANDGNPDSNYYHGSCSHTWYETDPWWTVTFKRLVLVNEVILVNRGDCCGKFTDSSKCIKCTQIHIKIKGHV